MSVDIVNFGCRLNAYEGEAIRQAATGAGLTDAIVINSCAVTAEAERQARQAIRRIRRDNPAARIVVTGCAAQTGAQRFAAMAEVDRVIGNLDKMQPQSWRAAAEALADPAQPRVAVSDIMTADAATARLVSGIDGNPRAYVQIQNGCDHRCTFCIIPFGRGPSRSVPMAAVIDEVRAQIAAGIGEVVLTGVDITSYGDGLPGAQRLGALVRAVLRACPDLPRLRLSSIDAVEADDDLLAALAEEPRLMPHLHLSLQSGDGMILKRMKRRHAPRDAVEFCAALRKARPDIVLGADFIAGFPTETEAMFARTLAHAEECGLTFLHVFPFSPRPGTPAARMPQPDRALVRERAARLREKGAALLRATLRGEIGRTRAVFVEQTGRGRTEHFLPVMFGATEPRGAIRDMAITGETGSLLRAA